MTKCLAEVFLVPIKGSSVIVVKNAWQGRVICRRGIMQMESRERQMGARSGDGEMAQWLRTLAAL